MTPRARELCAECGQLLREGDRFCMACGTERSAPAAEDEPADEPEAEPEWEYARIVPRVADRQWMGPSGASIWVYEAIGSHPTRGAYTARSSAQFSVADATFGPTLDWQGQLEGQEALALLLTDLRAGGWQLVAGQWAADRLLEVLPGRLRDEGASGEGWQLVVRQERPVWSRFIFRRPAST